MCQLQCIVYRGPQSPGSGASNHLAPALPIQISFGMTSNKKGLHMILPTLGAKFSKSNNVGGHFYPYSQVVCPEFQVFCEHFHRFCMDFQEFAQIFDK